MGEEIISASPGTAPILIGKIETPECYLAFSTGTVRVGVSLCYRGSIWSVGSSGEYTSIELIPLCGKLFNLARIDPRDLRGVIVSDGPGSYTGLRTGFSAALGFSAAYQLPVLSLPVLFWGRHDFSKERFSSALRASPADLYLQSYEQIAEAQYRLVGGLEVVRNSDFSPDLADLLDEELVTPDQLLRCAVTRRLEGSEFRYPFLQTPLYGKGVRALTRAERKISLDRCT